MYLFLTILLSFSFSTVILVPEDYPTIQQGIDASIDGDSVIVFAGIYYEIINYNGKDIIVTASFGPDSTIIDANGTGPAVKIENVESNYVELSGFTIQNAYNSADGGAVYVVNSSPNFKDLIIHNNLSWNKGGGVYINGGSQTFRNCQVNNNRVIDQSGNGGGMYCIHSENLLIEDCEFNYNSSYKNGTGLYLNDSQVIINNSKIIGNNQELGYDLDYDFTSRPIPKGGGIYVYLTDIYLYNNVINSNISSGPGGGIFGFESAFIIYHTEISNNKALHPSMAAEGGGAVFLNSTILLDHITLAYNNAPANTDGLLLRNTTAQISNSILYGNNGSEIILRENACVMLDYSNIMGGLAGIYGSIYCSEFGLNNIDDDPLFSDPENLIYTLQYNSPCIDAGTADIDGDGNQDNSDYNGLAPDMGSYEYENTTSGDLNGDGVIDILDIVILADMILNDMYSVEADLNEDGNINILDIVIYCNIILGS